ncbi:HAD family hydrolase [Humidisolicoccus flavus]|uniref:HAD family hydrolase n=1 Tax=Humidisolicoccus flavus TaxID=3111414 RepID=UPI0032461C0A
MGCPVHRLLHVDRQARGVQGRRLLRVHRRTPAHRRRRNHARRTRRDLATRDPGRCSGNDTAWALGNRKNEFFNAELKEHGVAAYPGSKAFLDAVLAKGLDVAVVSSSKNAEPVLETADLRKHFDIVIDGLVAADLGIAGKPAPDTFIYAAQKLGFEPEQCVVLEDAHSGVSAGRAGNFGLVVGVDRGIGAAALIEAGADEVVTDLADLIPSLNHKNEI